jgi:hypothetical protein
MLFTDRRHQQIAVERLARLLTEKPMTVHVNTAQSSYDYCRALVKALLLASVAGTWSVAFFVA